MSDAVIQVDHLSKRYILAHEKASGGNFQYRRFSDVLINAAKAPFQMLRKKETDPSRTREEFWALRDVSFEIKRGEVVGIIGRNGAGKSTLLKILSRITEPTSGRVEIDGRVASLLEVGTGFHPELTGRENIYLNGAILGMTRREITAKFDEIVAFAEVEKFLDTPVRFYSSGMYVRLAFAVAAHLEPEILIVDEVLAVGDAQFQKKCLGKMQDVSARDGRTVLFVSHNMAAVSQLCTSALLLDKGKLTTNGSVPETTAIYISSFTKKSTGEGLDHVKRTGEGHARFTAIWIEDAEGKIREEVSSGDKIVIAARYCSTAPSILRNVRLSFCLTDSIGTVLFLGSTELTAPHVSDLPPEGIVRCVYPKLPLSGGQYPIIAYLEVNGTVQDFIEDAAVLHVSDGNFYRSGKLYPPGWQGKGTLVEHEWILPQV